MSPLDKPVPPAGDDIHLPGGSVQPVLLALFITLALIGVTVSMVLVVLGVIGTIWVIAAWIRDARREMAELPIHHDGH